MATHNANGSAAQQMEALRATFSDRGLSFRHFADCRCSELRWQAIREVTEPLTLPDGSVRLVERFELLAWASSSDGLIEQLA